MRHDLTVFIPLCSHAQILLRLVEVAQAEFNPSHAVEYRSTLRHQRIGFIDQFTRLMQTIGINGEGITKSIQRLGIFRVNFYNRPHIPLQDLQRSHLVSQHPARIEQINLLRMLAKRFIKQSHRLHTLVGI